MSIGERLKYAREQAGLTLNQAAKLLSHNTHCLAKCESGAWNDHYKKEDLKQYSDLYKVNEDWLYSGINPNFDLSKWEAGCNKLKNSEERAKLIKLLEAIS